MLEIIHVMIQTKHVNSEMQRDIIFLFNGAEEVILAASHGFITKVDYISIPFDIINCEISCPELIVISSINYPNSTDGPKILSHL